MAGPMDNSWQGNGAMPGAHRGFDNMKKDSAWRDVLSTQHGGGGGTTGSRRSMGHDGEEKGKMFVGGLSWETTQDTLQRYFSQYGDVIDCVVMKNSDTGRSRGFGFVTFSDPSKVDLVLKSGPHELDGRTIDPKICNSRYDQSEQIDPKASNPRSQQKQKKQGLNWPKVFLGGLPSNLTETDLRSFFSRYGQVMEVVIMFDQEKKKSRGFGFLSFDGDEAVERAVSEHFVNINGKQVEIKKAEPRDNNKIGDGSEQWGSAPDSQWGIPGMGPPGMPGMNNGMSSMGPPMGHPMAPHGSGMGGPAAMSTQGMVQTYQGWGTPPAQQGYAPQGYAAPQAPQYSSWGAGQQIQQWGAAGYGSAGSQQPYGSYGGAPSNGGGGSAPKASEEYNWGQYYGQMPGGSTVDQTAAFGQHRAAAAPYNPMAAQSAQPPPQEGNTAW